MAKYDWDLTEATARGMTAMEKEAMQGRIDRAGPAISPSLRAQLQAPQEPITIQIRQRMDHLINQAAQLEDRLQSITDQLLGGIPRATTTEAEKGTGPHMSGGIFDDINKLEGLLDRCMYEIGRLH